MRNVAVGIVLFLSGSFGCARSEGWNHPPSEKNSEAPQTVAWSGEKEDVGQIKITPKKAKKPEKVPKEKKDKNIPAGWFGDYDQALARAKAAGKPLLVVFH
jgi:hypothetical protein